MVDICEMCAHRIPSESNDFNCNKKCDEYMEFVVLPVYESAPDMHEMLQQLEWSIMSYECDTLLHRCPICGAYQADGHHVSCRLQFILAIAEGRQSE